MIALVLKEYEDTQVPLCIVKLSQANILYFYWTVATIHHLFKTSEQIN